MIGAKTCRRVFSWPTTRWQHEKDKRTATLMLATRSAKELPTAKMVRPMMASESPKMKPKVYEYMIRPTGDAITAILEDEPEALSLLHQRWP